MYTVNNTNFFDFGVNVGDTELEMVLDGSSPPINLSTPIQFIEIVSYLFCLILPIHTTIPRLFRTLTPNGKQTSDYECTHQMGLFGTFFVLFGQAIPASGLKLSNRYLYVVKSQSYLDLQFPPNGKQTSDYECTYQMDCLIPVWSNISSGYCHFSNDL